MNQIFLTAGIGVISAFIGASIQFFYSRRGEAAKHLRDLQSKAYTDFMAATAALAIAQNSQNKDK